MPSKQYAKLSQAKDYDKEAVDELAEALDEIRELEQRRTFLMELVAENNDLHPYVWRTAEGKNLPLHKVEDDHLANIMQHLLDRGLSIKKEIKAEATKRGIEIPTESKFLGAGVGSSLKLGHGGHDEEAPSAVRGEF